MSIAKTEGISETDVVRLWQQILERRYLVDTENQPLEVVYPGRLNDSRGGDFKDAVVISGNQSFCGCIEVHTATSGWQSHGHQRDPSYNQVVLHVALKQDRPGKTVLQNGRIVPTVVLEKYLQPETADSVSEPGWPCHYSGLKQGSAKIADYLQQAGMARFETKAARYPPDSNSSESGQALYEGVAEALGYAKNKNPFRELARRVPLEYAEKMTQAEGKNWQKCLFRLQAWLLGTAGFLPSQRSLKNIREEPAGALDRAWSSLHLSNSMSPRDWELFKVRPGNYPVRRIVALCHLLVRYRQKGWLKTLLDLVCSLPEEKGWSRLEPYLIVAAEGYWARHYDFGAFNPQVNPVLLGRERAAEIAVNILLPFVFSWSQWNDRPALGQKVMKLYTRYPRLGKNSVELHMIRQLNINPGEVNSACRQQGLIHIYKTFCTRGKCRECILTK